MYHTIEHMFELSTGYATTPGNLEYMYAPPDLQIPNHAFDTPKRLFG